MKFRRKKNVRKMCPFGCMCSIVCLFVCFSSFYSSLYVSLSFNLIAYFGLIKTVQFYIRTKFTCCKTMHNTIVLITFPCIELPIEGKNYQKSFFFCCCVRVSLSLCLSYFHIHCLYLVCKFRNFSFVYRRRTQDE